MKPNIKEINYKNTRPNFSINSYDGDGDKYESGLFLHFGDVRVRISDGDPRAALERLVLHLNLMKKELREASIKANQK